MGSVSQKKDSSTCTSPTVAAAERELIVALPMESFSRLDVAPRDKRRDTVGNGCKWSDAWKKTRNPSNSGDYTLRST